MNMDFLSKDLGVNGRWKRVLIGYSAITLIIVGFALQTRKSDSNVKPTESKQIHPDPEGSLVTTEKSEADRISRFNDLESNNKDHIIYKGLECSGHRIWIDLSDSWNFISKDSRETIAKGIVSRWFVIGSAAGIKEPISRWDFEFRHAESHRTIAKWDSAYGYREID